MGTSKVWLDCEGEYFLTRVVKTIGQVVTPVVVAARPGQELPSLPDEARIAYDSISDGGPLAGLLAAFDALADDCDAVFVCACDQPLIAPGFVKRFTQLLEDNQAVVIKHENRIHALTAVYRLSVRPQLAEMVAGREFKARDFALHCGAVTLPSSLFLEVDPELASLRNINDPESYRDLRDQLKK